MRALILDCNYICHAVFYSMPALQTNHQYTQIIFGFIKKLIMYSQQFKPNNICFAWDSVHSVRKEIYPIYKSQRADKASTATEAEKHAKRSAFLQFTDIRESVLPDLGFTNVFMQEGYEGDDVMASVVDCNPSYDFTMITTDGDMYQTISDNCRIYNPITKTLRTVESFTAEYGCKPSEWGEVKAICGCSTDNVKGVKGVGEKTAIRYLNGELDPTSKKSRDIQASEDTIIENRELVVIPMYGTKDFILNEQNSLSRQKFVKVCEKYNFKSLLSKKNLDIWDEIIV